MDDDVLTEVLGRSPMDTAMTSGVPAEGIPLDRDL
jgi:hypothetical protein